MCNYYRPQAEGNVSTIGLMTTRSLIGLVTALSVRILVECCVVRCQNGLILSVPPSLQPEPQAPNQFQYPKPTHGIMLALMVMWSLSWPSLLWWGITQVFSRTRPKYPQIYKVISSSTDLTMLCFFLHYTIRGYLHNGGIEHDAVKTSGQLYNTAFLGNKETSGLMNIGSE